MLLDLSALLVTNCDFRGEVGAWQKGLTPPQVQGITPGQAEVIYIWKVDIKKKTNSGCIFRDFIQYAPNKKKYMGVRWPIRGGSRGPVRGRAGGGTEQAAKKGNKTKILNGWTHKFSRPFLLLSSAAPHAPSVCMRRCAKRRWTLHKPLWQSALQSGTLAN